MASAADVFEQALAYKEVAIVALADTPLGAPECAYVSEGPLIPDDQCLVVWVGGPALADTFPLQPALAPSFRWKYGEVMLVTLTAAIMRCATKLDEYGDLPQPADHETVALQTSSDVWAIWNHVKAAHKAGTLLPGGLDPSEFFMDAAAVQPQEGALTGWQITIRGTIGGYL